MDFQPIGPGAIVTGASRGIGRALARTLTDAGCRVVLVARQSRELESLAEELKGSIAIAEDLRSVDGCRRAVSRAISHLGDVHILVNNAGVNIPKAALEVQESDWDAVLNLNLKSTFFMAQAVGRHMIERHTEGTIVNIASQMAAVGYYQRAAYCASKSGVAGITRVLAIEWASHKITVNALAPTFVDTDLSRSTLQDSALRDDIMSRIPLGRLATLQEVASAVAYLVSKQARMVTGATLFVDGGWTAW